MIFPFLNSLAVSTGLSTSNIQSGRDLLGNFLFKKHQNQRSQLSGRKAWPGGPNRPAETPGRPGRPVWRTPRPNVVLDLAIYGIAYDAYAPYSNSLPRVPAL
jgi:hypothetical protein